MSNLLPIIGIVLAVIATLLGRRATEERPARSPARTAMIAGGVLAVAIIGVFLFGAAADATLISAGLVIGTVAVVTGGLSTSNSAAKVAWGVAFGSVAQMLPASPGAAFAMIAAAGLVGAVAGGSLTAVALAGVVMADRIGALGSPSATMPLAGSVFGLTMALVAVVCALDGKTTSMRVGAAIGLQLIFAYLVAGMWLKEMNLASALMLGVAAGGVLHFLVPQDEDTTTLAVGIAAVIGVALATMAFALAQGTGMAFALLGALAVVGILGNRRALLTLGPLAGLVLFRIFRTVYPETSKAFDIGQHYALVGLLLGTILPLLLSEWQQKRERTVPVAIAALLWGLLMASVAPLLIAFLGAYGTVGLLVGVGLAGVVEAVRQGRATSVLSVGVGIGGTVLLTYGWMSKSIDLTRDQKINVLIFAAVGIALLVAAITVLSRSKEVK